MTIFCSDFLTCTVSHLLLIIKKYTFSVKYIGIYSGLLCWGLLIQDFWRLLPNKQLTDRQLLLDYLVSIQQSGRLQGRKEP